MIIYISEDFLIINKIYNLSSQNGTNVKYSLDTMLQLYNEKEKENLKLVHRLDKSVTGLMVIGRNDKFVRSIGKDIKEFKLEKIYLCITQNIPYYLMNFLTSKIINISETKKTISFFSGKIKSNLDCDKYEIILKNRYKCEFNQSLKIIKPSKNSYSNNNLENFEMFGKFKISHLIFYDKNYNDFKSFDIDMLPYYDEETYFYFDQFFKNIENNSKDYEVYSVIIYELDSGRKHQIRKHMSKCFLSPIFNDGKYMFDEIFHRMDLKNLEI